MNNNLDAAQNEAVFIPLELDKFCDEKGVNSFITAHYETNFLELRIVLDVPARTVGQENEIKGIHIDLSAVK